MPRREKNSYQPLLPNPGVLSVHGDIPQAAALRGGIGRSTLVHIDGRGPVELMLDRPELIVRRTIGDVVHPAVFEQRRRRRQRPGRAGGGCW